MHKSELSRVVYFSNTFFEHFNLPCVGVRTRFHFLDRPNVDRKKNFVLKCKFTLIIFTILYCKKRYMTFFFDLSLFKGSCQKAYPVKTDTKLHKN